MNERFFINGVEVTKEEEVDFCKKIANFTGAGRRMISSILAGKQPLVLNEEQERRLAICAECEFFNGITCRKCGCHIRFKAKLQTEHCPILKW